LFIKRSVYLTKMAPYVQRKKCSTCRARRSTKLFAPGSPTCVGCRKICKGCYNAPCLCIKDFRKRVLYHKILLCQERDYPLMTILQKKCHEQNSPYIIVQDVLSEPECDAAQEWLGACESRTENIAFTVGDNSR